MINGASASTVYANTANLSAQKSAQTSSTTNSTAKTTSAEKTTTITDTVTISPAAQTLSALKTASVSYYEQFFPARNDTYSVTALAQAIVDPSVETISSGKTISEVAEAARENMDTKYAKMKAEGDAFDYNTSEGEDWYALYGELDRRALYAVSNNESGLFTKEEQDIAQSIMSGQQGWAMGLPNGPSRLVDGLVSIAVATIDHAASFKSGVKWLDKVSNDEKTSVAWASSRAAAQISYEWVMEGRGENYENLDSDNPLVKLIKSAMETMKDNYERGVSSGSIRNADDLKQQAWFKGFEGQLDSAILQTKASYNLSV
jgi:hypothetical protein